MSIYKDRFTPRLALESSSEPKDSIHFNTQDFLLKLILTETCHQLLSLQGKKPQTTNNAWVYQTPVERFAIKKEYELEEKKNFKTMDEKKLAYYYITKDKIKKDLDFVCSILQSAVVEMDAIGTYESMKQALSIMSKHELDEYNIINIHPEDKCFQLMKDIKRIDKKLSRFHHENFKLWDEGVREESATLYENMIKERYVRKWVNSQEEMIEYEYKKKTKELKHYINDNNVKMRNDRLIHNEITNFETFRVAELNSEIEATEKKIDNEHDKYEKDILRLKMKYEYLVKNTQLLRDEIEHREVEMRDYLVVKRIREENEIELQRLAEEQEIERLENEKLVQIEAANKPAKKARNKKKRRRG